MNNAINILTVCTLSMLSIICVTLAFTVAFPFLHFINIQVLSFLLPSMVYVPNVHGQCIPLALMAFPLLDVLQRLAGTVLNMAA